MKIYLASDLHLGYENTNYPKIIEFLNRVQNDGDKLIILGDLLDLWISDFTTITTLEPMKSAWKKLIETSKKLQMGLLGSYSFCRNKRQISKLWRLLFKQFICDLRKWKPHLSKDVIVKLENNA